MKKNAINNKLKFYTAGDYINIFCKKQYKNYYLRGEAHKFIADLGDTEICKYLADINPDIAPGIVYYNTIIFALVNDEYQKRAKKNTNENYPQVFIGNTKEDFLIFDMYLSNSREILYFKENFKEFYKHCEKDTLIIDLEDADIIENSYLNESIESKKDIILLSIDIIFDRIESTTYDLFKERYPKKNYPLLAYYFSKNADLGLDRFEDYELIYSFISELYSFIYHCFDYAYDEKKYHKMLEDIGNVCLEWLNQQKITNRYLNSLNSFKNCQTSDADPLTRFCNNFFYELINDLKNQKMIKQCQFCDCGDFFKYKENKKYCSQKYEGKDCARTVSNKRYYERHKEEIKPKARKLMKEQRECYKKYGIKK